MCQVVQREEAVHIGYLIPLFRILKEFRTATFSRLQIGGVQAQPSSSMLARNKVCLGILRRCGSIYGPCGLPTVGLPPVENLPDASGCVRMRPDAS